MPERTRHKEFYTCTCRWNQNFFLHSVGSHFNYNGDDNAFLFDYEMHQRQLGNDGDGLPTFQEALADIKEQREKRIRGPREALARAKMIEESYSRLHPHIYVLDHQRFLTPDFLEIVNVLKDCEARPTVLQRCIDELKQRDLLQEPQPQLWTFSVLTQDCCDLLERELSHFEKSGLPNARPNTMNRQGSILSELGFCEGLLDPLVFEHVDPLATKLLPWFTDGLDSYRAFTVKYQAAGGDKDLALHYDNAEVTLNVNIGGDWEGGQVTFFGFNNEAPRKTPYSARLLRGQGVLHAGCEMHKAEPIESGERQNLILWCRSSEVRNGKCPMCFDKPKIVSANKYVHEGFTAMD